MITGPAFSLVAAALLIVASAAALRWPALVVSWPRCVLAALGAITLGALAMIVRLSPLGLTIGVDPASEPLLPLGDPGREVYRQATLDFGNDDIYIVAMETASGVFTRENLQVLRRITDSIRKLPGVRDAESLTHTDLVWWNPDPGWVEVSAFIGQIPSEEGALTMLRERALAHPIYPKTLVSKDALTAAINVTFQPMTDAEFVELDLDGEIQRLLDRETGHERRFFVAGRPHVRAQAYHLMVGDIVRLVPLAIAVAAAALWLMTGSLRGMLFPLVSCITATLWAFGAMALLEMSLNLITLVLAPMLICVGSVYGVHVIARFETISETASDSRQAALDCLMYTRAPVAMAGVTTCIGYGALQLADIQATNELGAFSILGVASVTLLSLTGVPAALSLLPLEGSARHSSEPLYTSRNSLSAWLGRRIERLLAAMATLVTQRPEAVLVGWALTAGIALLLIPRIVIDTDVLTFFLEDSRVRTDFAAVNEALTGAVPIYVSLIGDEEGTFREPENLRALERVQGRLEEIPGVSEVLSSTDLVKMTQRAIAGGAQEHARIPDTRAAVAETLFMLPKSRLRPFLNSNHSRANLIVRTGRSGSAAILELEARIRQALAESKLPGALRAEVTGNAILINRSADGIAGNQASQMGFAAATILIMVSILFGSLRVGSLSMIPNVVPVIAFFGVLGAGVASLSVPTSLIGSIALGIAIDDTVHFLVSYQRGRAAGGDPEEVARQCMQQVGRPIIMTTVMLVVGFLVMLFSGFATLREFGYLTALTMLICLLADLLLLPALLVRLRA